MLPESRSSVQNETVSKVQDTTKKVRDNGFSQKRPSLRGGLFRKLQCTAIADLSTESLGLYQAYPSLEVIDVIDDITSTHVVQGLNFISKFVNQEKRQNLILGIIESEEIYSD
jgi:hypothetical protein